MCRIPCLILCLAYVECVGQSEPVVELPHTGTIITDQPDVMWGTDATAAVTMLDGQVMVFAAIDPCTAECVGIQAAIHGDRFEALEPLRWCDDTRCPLKKTSTVAVV